MPCFLAMSLSLNQGSHMSMPSAFTSALRATTQPSLLDSTTTGLPSSRGLNTRSQET